MKPPLILIDASSYFFRAFHALPPLTNSKGQPTGAVYGVVNMIKKLIKDYNPQALAVVFDAKGKTFREEWYPEYKAHRPTMPSELSSQFKPLIEVLEAMGLPLLIVEGVEADDVIGTLAKQATAHGLSVVVSTSDKDLAQLVNDKVSLINTMNNYIMDVAGVKEKFGVNPEQIIDYLTLVGDTSDNIPGVSKCGPKTAVKWLTEYKTLDNLIAHANDIGGKVGEYLRDSISHLPLSKKLVTIITDLELPLKPEELSLRPVDYPRLLELIEALEFKNWLKELLQQNVTTEAATTPSPEPQLIYEVITTQQQLQHWLRQLEQCDEFCINTQRTDLDIMSAALVGLSLALGEGKAAYIPFMHTDGTPQLSKQEVLAALKPVLENPNIKKIGQNIKADYGLLKNYGIHLQGITHDLLLESYVLNSTSGKHDLDNLSLKYLGHKTIGLTDIAGKGAKKLRFDQIPTDKAAAYAAGNADVALQLHQKLYPMLEERLQSVFHDIEMPLLTVLADMEHLGVLIDAGTLKKHAHRLNERINLIVAEALQLAGKPFNLNSPKQLQEILFDELKLPVRSKTPTGQPSTAESVLQELAMEYRIAALVLEYRSLTKLVSTYIESLPQKINSKTNRVHTSYNQAVTATGRLSSSEPNLQNIPIRSEEGRLIRTAFIAPPGAVLLAADYSQIELRIMAHLSQDENLIKAFANGWDIHTATASEIFETPLDEVSHEQRRRAKAINFGLIYGMSAFGLAKQIGIDRHDAQFYINTYFKRYPKVLEYMERTRLQAHEQGFVETLFGRRLYLPDINARNIMLQKASERMAINAPMQGTAADIIKKAMLDITQWQKTQDSVSVKMIMQVHDELVFEVMEEELEVNKAAICNLMEQAVSLSVPLVVTMGVGLNWDDAH